MAFVTPDPVHFLIASDVDGTLFTTPEKRLEPGMMELMRTLPQYGGVFCIASGRSWPSLQEAFAPVVDSVLFLAENGARAYWHGELAYTVTMPQEPCRALVEQLAARPDCEVRINTLVDNYCILQKGVQPPPRAPGMNFQIIQSFAEIEGEITKVCAYFPAGAAAPAKELLPQWQSLGAMMTGVQWIDFTCAGKGIGLQRACEFFKVPLEHTAAFGDYFNDAPMLELTGHPYLMASAPAELKARFPMQSTSVYQTLTQQVLPEFAKL